MTLVTEKRRLHYDINAVSKPCLLGNLSGVYIIKFYFFRAIWFLTEAGNFLSMASKSQWELSKNVPPSFRSPTIS